MDNINKIKGLKGPDIQVALNDLYSFSYKLQNVKELKSRPLLSVAFSQAEDINKYSILESTLRNFISKDIYTLFGLNLKEFLSLPHDIAEMLVEIANDKQIEKVKQVKQMQASEEELTKKIMGS